MKNVLHFRNSARLPNGAMETKYDLCINTGIIGIEYAVEMILEYIRFENIL